MPDLARMKMGKIFLKIDNFFSPEILKSESFCDIIFKMIFCVAVQFGLELPCA